MVGLSFFVVLALRNIKVIKYTVTLLVLFIGIMLFSENINNQVTTIINDAFAVDVSATQGTDFYRTNAYLNGIDFLKKTYGFGVSPGNVEYWMENYGERFTNNTKPLHNWWLEVAVSSGLIISILMIRVWIKYYIDLFKLYISKNKKKNELLIISLVMSMGLVYAIVCISPSSLYKIEWPWALLSIFFLMKKIIINIISKEC